jgi:nitrite reductase/ring-hydroxylating ferredoxin subunit
MPWVPVLAAAAVVDDEMVRAKLNGRDIAVARVGGQLHAFEGICTHQHAFLSDGVIEDGCVECPVHGGRFDLTTGRAVAPPAMVPLTIYRVKLEAGQVLVEID